MEVKISRAGELAGCTFSDFVLKLRKIKVDAKIGGSTHDFYSLPIEQNVSWFLSIQSSMN